MGLTLRVADGDVITVGDDIVLEYQKDPKRSGFKIHFAKVPRSLAIRLHKKKHQTTLKDVRPLLPPAKAEGDAMGHVSDVWAGRQQSKGGQNPPNESAKRPPAPGGSDPGLSGLPKSA